jgi:hypothetical protein
MRRLVGLQVEHVAGNQREEQIAGVEPDAAEHALRRDRTKRIELLNDLLSDDVRAIVAAPPVETIRRNAFAAGNRFNLNDRVRCVVVAKISRKVPCP